MYSELCNWCFTQLEHKYVCFSSNSCRVLHGENAIGTNKRACKLRGGLASTSALAITKRIIDIMLNFFFNPLTIQVFEEAHLLGSGISQEQNINDSIIWRIAEGQGASEECTLRQGSENQHLSHTSAYFRGFLHLSQDCTVLLSWAGFGHTKKSRVFPTVLQGRVQSNFPFTSQKKKKKDSLTPWSLNASRFHRAWNLTLHNRNPLHLKAVNEMLPIKFRIQGYIICITPRNVSLTAWQY